MEATWLRALAFVHPAWMLASLALAITTARLGLRIRRLRARDRPVGAGLQVARPQAGHLRFGRLTLGLVAVGFLLGPSSMVLLRDRPAFDSLHGILGLIVLGLFAWTGWSGRGLARGRAEARDVHRIAAASAIAAAMLSAVAGFVLLP